MPVATVRTAALTGAFAALAGVFLGPLVDAPGSRGTVWLLVSVAALGLPAYFFVFGLTREETVGPWVLQPALLSAWPPACSER